jgi:hypothetical protein
MLRRRGDAQRARVLYERALAAGLPGELDRAARRELARLAKRDRDFTRANELWSELAGADPRVPLNAGLAHGSAPTKDLFDADAALEAYEQLAIYFEHHAREPQRAVELTREALAALAAAHGHGNLSHVQNRRLRDRLQHRLARLEKKSAIGKFALEQDS